MITLSLQEVSEVDFNQGEYYLILTEYISCGGKPMYQWDMYPLAFSEEKGWQTCEDEGYNMIGHYEIGNRRVFKLPGIEGKTRFNY